MLDVSLQVSGSPEAWAFPVPLGPRNSGHCQPISRPAMTPHAMVGNIWEILVDRLNGLVRSIALGRLVSVLPGDSLSVLPVSYDTRTLRTRRPRSAIDARPPRERPLVNVRHFAQRAFIGHTSSSRFVIPLTTHRWGIFGSLTGGQRGAN